MKSLKRQGGWVGAAIAAGSALYSASQAQSGAESTNARQMALARKQMRFQRHMSNTAVRRRMRDLRRAGINPILAGKYDASSPAGAMATLQNTGATMAQGMSAGANMANSAFTGEQSYAMVDQIKATTVKTLGETSFGQRIINEMGGAENLATTLAEDPELRRKVESLMDKFGGPIYTWPDQAKEALRELLLGSGKNPMDSEASPPSGSGLRIPIESGNTNPHPLRYPDDRQLY